MTDKSNDKVGHLNTSLAIGGGNLNNPIFKSSNARGLPGGGGGMLKFRVDRRIIVVMMSCLLVGFSLSLHNYIFLFNCCSKGVLQTKRHQRGINQTVSDNFYSPLIFSCRTT